MRCGLERRGEGVDPCLRFTAIDISGEEKVMTFVLHGQVRGIAPSKKEDPPRRAKGGVVSGENRKHC